MAAKRLSKQQTDRIAQQELDIVEHFNNGNPSQLRTGLVTGSFGHDVIIEHNDNEEVQCKVRRDRTRPVCGDKVLWIAETENSNIIEAVLPRHSLLERPDGRGVMRTVAANIDRIAIIIAPKPAFNEGLLDRYLVAAGIINVKTLIVLNKIDLLGEAQRDDLHHRLTVYKKLDYDIIETSTKKQHGLDDLLGKLAGHTSILVGQSGVGKSSLVNHLLPGITAETDNISGATGKGKHTTTSARLYHLPGGGHLIDSPGIREFGLTHASPADVRHAYPEITNAAGHCKFNDCSHQNEPGCAVQQAINDNAIDAGRFKRYQRILETIDG